MKIFARDYPLTPSWDLVRPSWELLKENFWPIFYLGFIPGLVSAVGNTVMGDTHRLVHGNHIVLDHQFIVGAYIISAAAVLSLIAYPGYIYAQLKGTEHQQIAPWEAFMSGIKYFIPFVVLAFIEVITVTVGFLLFVIPGLIALRALYLSPYYLMDKKLSPVEAMKQSYRDSKDSSGWIWGSLGVLLAFALLGSLFAAIPIAGPVLAILPTYAYIFGMALRYREVSTRKRQTKPVQEDRE